MDQPPTLGDLSAMELPPPCGDLSMECVINERVESPNSYDTSKANLICSKTLRTPSPSSTDQNTPDNTPRTLPHSSSSSSYSSTSTQGSPFEHTPRTGWPSDENLIPNRTSRTFFPQTLLNMPPPTAHQGLSIAVCLQFRSLPHFSEEIRLDTRQGHRGQSGQR